MMARGVTELSIDFANMMKLDGRLALLVLVLISFGGLVWERSLLTSIKPRKDDVVEFYPSNTYNQGKKNQRILLAGVQPPPSSPITTSKRIGIKNALPLPSPSPSPSKKEFLNAQPTSSLKQGKASSSTNSALPLTQSPMKPQLATTHIHNQTETSSTGSLLQSQKNRNSSIDSEFSCTWLGPTELEENDNNNCTQLLIRRMLKDNAGNNNNNNNNIINPRRWFFFGDATMARLFKRSPLEDYFVSSAIQRINDACSTSSDDRTSGSDNIHHEPMNFYSCHSRQHKRCRLRLMYQAPTKIGKTNQASWQKPNFHLGEGPIQFGLSHPDCMDCSGCNSIYVICSKNVSASGMEETPTCIKQENAAHGGYFALDYVRDVEIQSNLYNTTQQHVAGFLRRHWTSSFTLNKDFGGLPYCVWSTTSADLKIPSITLQIYLKNVEQYLLLMKPHCSHIIWLGNIAPKKKQYREQVRLWNDGTRNMIQSHPQLREHVTEINVFEASLIYGGYQGNFYMDDPWYWLLGKYFLELSQNILTFTNATIFNITATKSLQAKLEQQEQNRTTTKQSQLAVVKTSTTDTDAHLKSFNVNQDDLSCVWGSNESSTRFFGEDDCTRVLTKRILASIRHSNNRNNAVGPRRWFFFGDSTMSRLFHRGGLKTHFIRNGMNEIARTCKNEYSCYEKQHKRCNLNVAYQVPAPTTWIAPNTALGEGPLTFGKRNPGCTDW